MIWPKISINLQIIKACCTLVSK